MAKTKTLKINRLLEIIELLNQNPDGLSAQQIAEKTGRTVRTIFRDFTTLKKDLSIQLTVKSGKWKISPGKVLPPVRFEYKEAVTLFSALRVFLSLTNVYNPLIGSTFSKLNSILPSTINNQMKKTISWLKAHNRKYNDPEILLLLSRAWLEGKRIKFRYFSILADKYIDRTLEIYLIQPVDRTRGIWVVGNCPDTKKIEMFSLARIEDIKLQNRKYTIPDSFNPVQYQFPVWKYEEGSETLTIKLKFSRELSRQVHETIWKLAHKIEDQPDGSVIATFSASSNRAFLLFVLEFGRMVEVLEPESLKTDVVNMAKDIIAIYNKK
jgi:predicted DNA-binding transcriptional regulator YafY